MFKALIRRLHISADGIVKSMALRALIALPFAVAAVFGVAALTTRLSTLYGPVTAYGVLAVAFLFIGLIGTAFAGREGTATDSAVPNEPTDTHDDASEADVPPLDIDTLVAAVAALGPSAVPVVARAAVRNWALLILAAAVVYLVNSDEAEQSSPVVPAE